MDRFVVPREHVAASRAKREQAGRQQEELCFFEADRLGSASIAALSRMRVNNG